MEGKQKIDINVNGVDYMVDGGQNVLEACRGIGVEIPFFCYHPSLKVAGSCRMCLVSVGMPARDRETGDVVKGEDGSVQIAWAPKLSIACGTKVAQGMHIVTDGDAVKKCRESVLEFLLLNHPLDCPICDKAGECKLQEYTHAYGRDKSRYVERKNVKSKHIDVSGKIILDSERCIECSRCIRFCEEFIGRSVFGFVNRGSKTEISVYQGGDNESNYLLNVVDGCPVGALTEKAFRFKMRPWFLKTTDSICAESSAGVNTRVWSRNGRIYRITPRRNDDVNGMFMSDSGRYVYLRFNDANRLKLPRIDSTSCDLGYAVSRCTEILKLGKVAIVANAWQTLEEMFLIREFSNLCGAEVYMASHIGEDDGKLVSADRTPNMRGAFVTGLLKDYPPSDLSALAEKIDSGEVATVLCLRENLLKLGFNSGHFKASHVIYCGSLENSTSMLAKVCIPMRNEFEKDGMWINRQWRVQKFSKAVDAAPGVADDSRFLLSLLGEYSFPASENMSTRSIREVMASRVPLLSGCIDVGATGVPIDPSPFDGVDFPEAEAYNFKRRE